jgi:acetyl esterase/lipase
MNVLDFMLSSAATLGEFHPETRRVRAQTVLLAEDIPYTDSGLVAHRLDLHAPKGARGKLPVLLHVHGGGFRILSKNSHRAIARRYAVAGYLVVNVNYRLTPEGQYPAALEDVCQALLWTLKNAESYGGDISRLAYAGESAGANLILCAAMLGCFERPEPWAKAIFAANPSPAALLPACGLFEVHNAARYLDNKKLPRWLRARIKVICEGYLDDETTSSLASPLHLLEGDEEPSRALPPIFAVCGDIDPVLDDSLRLGKVLKQRRLEGALELYRGSHHAFHLFFSANARRAWADQLEFLQAHLGVSDV